MICRKTVLKCRDGYTYIPVGAEVEVGTSIGECTVSISIPSKCVIDVSTEIKFANTRYIHKIDEDEENVYIVEIDSRTGKEVEMYVYHRDVWKKVYKFYMEPMMRGEPVDGHLLLVGAPGTGKTVMVTLIANMLGLDVETINVAEIKSKFYGESEKNLEYRLQNAVSREPLILLFDDADFIVTSRSLVGSVSSGVETTEVSLRIILFKYLENIIKERKRVLVIATTNMSPSAIDEALLRGGRFGEPIFISLPNYNALHRYAYFVLRDENKARDLAYRCVSRGLTISDLKTMIKYMRAGLNPDFRRISGRGYRRLYSEIVREFVDNKQLINRINKLYDFGEDRKTTIYMNIPFVVGVALITQIFFALKRPGILITDPMHVDEYTYTLDVTKSIGVVPTDLQQNIHTYIRNNTNQPLVFIGTNPPNIETYTYFISLQDMINMFGDDPKPVARAILEYYKIPYTDHDLKTIERIIRSRSVKPIDIFVAIANSGKVNEDIIGIAMLAKR